MKIEFDMNDNGWDIADKMLLVVLRDCLKNRIETEEDEEFKRAIEIVIKRFTP